MSTRKLPPDASFGRLVHRAGPAPRHGDRDEEPADLEAATDPSHWERAPDPDQPASDPSDDLDDDLVDADTYGDGGLGGWPSDLAGDAPAAAAPGDDDDDLDAPTERELERRIEAQRTPVFPIDLRRHLPMEALWRRWRRVAMWGRSDVVDDFGYDPKATARWEPVLEALYARWFRVEAEGLEHVPSRGGALLVANHGGSLPYDSAMVMHAVRRDHPARRDVRPLIEDAVFHLPTLGPLMNRLGGVRACPENAERLLDRGELVAVFPEGTKGASKLWRDRYQLQRFGRGGFIKLALRKRVPIIPVAVVGAEDTAPMLARVTWFARNAGLPFVPVTPTFPLLGPAGLLPLPAKWRLEFGPPIELARTYDAAQADDRLLVNRLADQVRTQLQAMVDGLRARRGRPFL